MYIWIKNLENNIKSFLKKHVFSKFYPKLVFKNNFTKHIFLTFSVILFWKIIFFSDLIRKEPFIFLKISHNGRLFSLFS